MKTALDSSVLLILLRREEGWESWREGLSQAAAEGPMLMCPVVFAECSAGFASIEQARRQFESLQISYDDIAPESAWLAGQMFLNIGSKKVREIILFPIFSSLHMPPFRRIGWLWWIEVLCARIFRS